MGMDRLIKSNGIIRNLFKDFLESEKFRLIIDKMRDEKIPVAEIICDSHRVIIDDFYHSNNSDTHDAQESEAEKRGKYFQIQVAIDGNMTKEINAHRIVNPDWWVLTEPPEDVVYLVASCWVNAKDYYDDLELLESTVEDVLENINLDKLYSYEAISIP